MAAHDQQSPLATVHVGIRKNKVDLIKYINEGVSNLDLGGGSDDLRSYIRDTMEEKADGMFLWVKLILAVLEKQRNEDQIRECLETAPRDIEGMIAEVLKAFSSTLKGNEAEELNVILAWVSCATRPLKLLELHAILRRTSHACTGVFSLEKRLRENYGSLIELHREDGLSTGSLQAQSQIRKTLSVSGVSAYDSNSRTTTVAFAHATISEFFRKGKGKFARRPYHPPIGVVLADAQYTILKTCLEVIVDPGTEGRLETARTLHSYAVQSWFHHLEKLRLCSDMEATTDESWVMNLLIPLLFDQDHLRSWCHEISWNAFSLTTADNITNWFMRIPASELSNCSPRTRSWIETCKERPPEVFRPAADLYAREGLHGDDWYAVRSIEALAQIRALIVGSRTLDQSPPPLSIDMILEAVDWAALTKTPTWYRKIAVCLRNCGHMNEAQENFEIALDMDSSLYLARRGLAKVYRDQRHYQKAIDLELENALLLCSQREAASGDSAKITEELCLSYEFIAYNYDKLEDQAEALQFWRKAFETGLLEEIWIFRYLSLLAESPKPDRWSEIIDSLLKVLEKREGPDGVNYLTHCILHRIWPGEAIPDFFYIVATAAKETDSIVWLEQAYQTAISTSPSHLKALVLRYSLIQIHKFYGGQYDRAEELIEEIAEIAILAGESTIQELVDCKMQVAQDFSLICVRKAAESDFDAQEIFRQLQKLRDFCSSGIKPFDIASKVGMGESAQVHLALLQKWSGDHEAAMKSVKPYILEATDMAISPESSWKMIGLRCLVEVLLVLGRDEEASALYPIARTLSAYWCIKCVKAIPDDRDCQICRYCFDSLCDSCSTTPSWRSFCTSSHSLLAIPAGRTLDQNHSMVFRNVRMDLAEAMALIRQDWGQL